jgi:hypothetical protein
VRPGDAVEHDPVLRAAAADACEARRRRIFDVDPRAVQVEPLVRVVPVRREPIGAVVAAVGRGAQALRAVVGDVRAFHFQPVGAGRMQRGAEAAGRQPDERHVGRTFDAHRAALERLRRRAARRAL